MLDQQQQQQQIAYLPTQIFQARVGNGKQTYFKAGLIYIHILY